MRECGDRTAIEARAPDSLRLCAWFVAESGADVRAAELRRFLYERLPPAAIPSVLVRVDALPLTANGKIDREALAVPRGESARTDRAPADELESGLLAHWRRYSGAHELPKVLDGLGIVVVSTSQGVMSDRQCREKNVGGEVLCKVW